MAATGSISICTIYDGLLHSIAQDILKNNFKDIRRWFVYTSKVQY